MREDFAHVIPSRQVCVLVVGRLLGHEKSWKTTRVLETTLWCLLHCHLLERRQVVGWLGKSVRSNGFKFQPRAFSTAYPSVTGSIEIDSVVSALAKNSGTAVLVFAKCEWWSRRIRPRPDRFRVSLGAARFRFPPRTSALEQL